MNHQVVEHQQVARVVVRYQPGLSNFLCWDSSLLPVLEDVGVHIVTDDMVTQAIPVRATCQGKAAHLLIDIHQRHPNGAEAVTPTNKEMVLMRGREMSRIIGQSVPDTAALKDKD